MFEEYQGSLCGWRGLNKGENSRMMSEKSGNRVPVSCRVL